ncbi:hypothetical protein DPMN_058395, partial [Dreissena polymorpha]
MAASRTHPSEETQKLLNRYISCGEYLVKISQELCEVPGAAKLERKCLAELKYLKSLSRRRGGYDVTHLRSSNINHYAGVLHAAKSLPQVTHLLQAFRCPERSEALHVDVVGAQGHLWIKVIARKAQALHLVWAGQGQFGERDIVDQGLDYIAASKVHPVDFTDPIIVFAFYGGVTSTLAEKIRDLGIVVIGHSVPLDDAVVTKIASLSFLGDESDEGDVEWDHFVQGFLYESESSVSMPQSDYQDAFEARLDSVYLSYSDDSEGLAIGIENAAETLDSVDARIANSDGEKEPVLKSVYRTGCVVNESRFEKRLATEYLRPVGDDEDEQLLLVGEQSIVQMRNDISGDGKCTAVTSCTSSGCVDSIVQSKLGLRIKTSPLTLSERTDFFDPCEEKQQADMTICSHLHNTSTNIEHSTTNRTLLMENSDGIKSGKSNNDVTMVKGRNQLQTIDLATTQKEYNSDEIVSGDINTCQSIRESNPNSELGYNMLLSKLSSRSQFSSETNMDVEPQQDVKCRRYANIGKWNFPDQTIQVFIENEILGNTLINYADLDSVLEKSTFESINSNPRVNLDVTTLITLVSSVANGNCFFKFHEKILAQQAEDERDNPVLPTLKDFLE